MLPKNLYMICKHTHTHKEKHSNNLGSSWNFLLKKYSKHLLYFYSVFINIHIYYLILNIQ